MAGTLPRGLHIAAVLLLACYVLPCRAQQSLATDNSPGTRLGVRGASTLVVKNLGDGAVALDGLWQFHLGDNPAWASPDFDDSHWEQLFADIPWGAQDHFCYTGYAWYRKHITVVGDSGAAVDLALMIRHVDNAYEIYWNGKLIGRNGQLPPHPIWFALSQPAQTFGWPSAGSGVMAIRVWKAPLLSEDTGLRGGLVAPPMAGTSAAILAAKTELDYRWLRGQQFVFGEDLLYTLVAVLGILAWVRDRRQWLLFWMSSFALASTFRFLLYGLGIPLPITIADGIAATLSSLRDISLWYMLLTLLQLRDKSGLLRLTRIFAIVSVSAAMLDGLLGFFGWGSTHIVAVQIADAILTVTYILTATLPLLLVGFAFSPTRRLSATSRLVAVVAFLSGMLQVVQNVAPQGIRFTHWTLAEKISTPLFTVNGNSISIVPMVGMLLLLTIVFAVYHNSLEGRRRQVALEQEFRSAREIQQVLIPETLLSVPGYALTSAYRPAQQVGGDFFQIIPMERDSTLILMGDVSGKGLKAAMAVALIVGLVRVLTDRNLDPAELLAELNGRLCGRLKGGFATCVAIRLDGDGGCSMASAGHPAPYLNQRELSLPAALPLGLMVAETYEQASLRLDLGDYLALYTDGLLEARSQRGELYGFDRLGELFATQPNAAQATQAAVDFGQDDDITVVTLTRVLSGKESSALQTLEANG